MRVPAWIFVATTVGLALGLALLFRNLFPKEGPPGIPRIITQYDTVSRDSIIERWRWRDKLVVDARTARERDSLRTLLERLTTTTPETVYVVPPLNGMTAVHAGAKIGDSTLAGGFSLEGLDSGYAKREWIAQFYTAGPVRSLVMENGRPAITFYPPPPKPCGTWCKLGYTGLGTSIGAGAGLLACAALR